jgi:hypothetical protein
MLDLAGIPRRLEALLLHAGGHDLSSSGIFAAASELLVSTGFQGVRYYEVAQESVPGAKTGKECFLAWINGVGLAQVGFSIPWSETSLAIQQRELGTVQATVTVHDAAWFVTHGLAIPEWVSRLGLTDVSWVDVPIVAKGELLGLLAADWRGPPGELTPDAISLLSALGAILGRELSAEDEPVADDLRAHLLDAGANFEGPDALVGDFIRQIRKSLGVASASAFRFDWSTRQLNLVDLVLADHLPRDEPPRECYGVGDRLTGNAWRDPRYRSVLDFGRLCAERPELAATDSVSFHEAVLGGPVRSIIYSKVGRADRRYLIRLINREDGSQMPFLRERAILQRSCESLSPLVDAHFATQRSYVSQLAVKHMTEPVDLDAVSHLVLQQLRNLEGITRTFAVARRIGNAQPHFFLGIRKRDQESVARILNDPAYRVLMESDKPIELTAADGTLNTRVSPLVSKLLQLGEDDIFVGLPFSSGATRGVLGVTVVASKDELVPSITAPSMGFLRQICVILGQAVEGQYIYGQAQGALRALSLVGHELASPLAVLGNAAHLGVQQAQDAQTFVNPADRAPGSYFEDLRERVDFSLEVVDSAVKVGKVVGQQVDRRFVGVRKEDSVRRLINLSIAQAVREISAGQLHSPTGLLIARADGPGDVRVTGDRGLLILALSNLYRNAAKYSLAYTERPRVTTKFDVIQTSVKKYVEIVVVNEGLEIPSEYRDLIFSPFVRYSEFEPDLAIRGMGLGLFLVREIARAHGGDVTIRRPERVGYFRRSDGSQLPVFRNPFALRLAIGLADGPYVYQLRDQGDDNLTGGFS